MKHCLRILSALPAILAVSLTSLSTQALARDVIIFTTAPTQSVKATRERYQPIADYLSRETGAKVVLRPAENFIQYSRGLIKNEYDLIFDGPQFVGWRMARDNNARHNVLVKLPGKLRFVVAVRNDIPVKRVKRLAGKRVCAFGLPNLLTLGFLDLYPNPSSVPVIVSVKNFKQSLACVKKKRGVAAIMRDKFWNKMTKLNKTGGLHLIPASKVSWPHRAFSIKASVRPELQEKIRRALLNPKAKGPSRKVLAQFRSKMWVPATAAEYQGHGRYLKPIWGFHLQ